MTRNVPDSELVTRSLDRVIRNPYRLLGLPGHASRAAIDDAVAATRRALKLGVEKKTPWDLPFLGEVPRSERVLQEAVGRLATPGERLRERLFWFHGDSAVSSASSPAALTQVAEVLLARGDGVSLHDAALSMLVATVLQDPTLAQGMRWIETFLCWRELAEDDDYWLALLETEIEGAFEPAATAAEIEALRDEAPRLVAEILAGIATRAVADDLWGIVRQALHIFRQCGFPIKVVSRAEEEILGPIEDAFEALCRDVLQECSEHLREDDESVGQNKLVCQRALRRFDGEVVLDLQTLVELAGPGSEYSRRARETAANCLFQLALAHTWGHQFAKAENLLKRARTLAPDTSAALQRIDAELVRIAPYAQQELALERLARGIAAPSARQPAGARTSPQGGRPAQQSQRPQPRAAEKRPARPGSASGPGKKSQRTGGRRSTRVVVGLALLATLIFWTNPQALRYLVTHIVGAIKEVVSPTATPTAVPPSRTRTPRPGPTVTRAPTRTPRPTPTAIAMRYRVKRGDTVGILSRRFGVPMAAILGANPNLTDPDVLDAGQELLIPLTYSAIVAAAERWLDTADVQLASLEEQIEAAPAGEQAALRDRHARLLELKEGIEAQYLRYLQERS